MLQESEFSHSALEGEGQYVSTECWLLYQKFPTRQEAGVAPVVCQHEMIGLGPSLLLFTVPSAVHIPAQPKDPGSVREEYSYSVFFSSARNSQQEGWLCSQTSDPFNVHSWPYFQGKSTVAGSRVFQAVTTVKSAHHFCPAPSSCCYR